MDPFQFYLDSFVDQRLEEEEFERECLALERELAEINENFQNTSSFGSEEERGTSSPLSAENFGSPCSPLSKPCVSPPLERIQCFVNDNNACNNSFDTTNETKLSNISFFVSMFESLLPDNPSVPKVPYLTPERWMTESSRVTSKTNPDKQQSTGISCHSFNNSLTRGLFHFKVSIGPYQSPLHIIKDQNDDFPNMIFDDEVKLKAIYRERNASEEAIAKAKRYITASLWGDGEKIVDLETLAGTLAVVIDASEKMATIKCKLPNLGGTSNELVLRVETAVIVDRILIPYTFDEFSFRRFTHLNKLPPTERAKTGKRTRKSSGANPSKKCKNEDFGESD